MLDFMTHVQAAFHTRTGWNPDQSYASLTTTATNLLAFPIPQGVRLHISSLSSPNFATSYTLASQGVVDGSLSFLYSSLGLDVGADAGLVKGYRGLHQSAPTENVHGAEAGAAKAEGRDGDGRNRDALLYGRLYLPTSTLEALYLRRISRSRLFRLSAVSSSTLPNGGTFLASLQNDFGHYSTEYLYSSDSSLLGIRGLYNFPTGQQQQHGRLSAGAEAYVSPLNKTGGVSCGLRFATLPIHTGFPYTMTLTVNPLMGNLSSTYAVRAGPLLALCSQFDFNVYSYESDVVVGMELWRRRQETAWASRMVRPGWKRAEVGEDVGGVLKARMDNHGKVGLLWECRVKELLVSLGAGFDLKQRERMLGRVGVEVSYSS